GAKSTYTNVVSDTVEIVAEARSVYEESLKTQLTKMKDAFQDTAEKYVATAEFDIKQMYPGFQFSQSDKVVQIAEEAAKTLDLPCELLKSGGGSDANIFNGYGIPTVNLSVCYEFIHTTEERIHNNHLTNLTKLVLQIIMNVTHS